MGPAGWAGKGRFARAYCYGGGRVKASGCCEKSPRAAGQSATIPAVSAVPVPVDTGVRKHEELRRVIGIWDAAALVIGLIIGSGIFRAPSSVARELPTPALMLAAWVIGGLLSLAGGLAAAELG